MFYSCLPCELGLLTSITILSLAVSGLETDIGWFNSYNSARGLCFFELYFDLVLSRLSGKSGMLLIRILGSIDKLGVFR